MAKEIYLYSDFYPHVAEMFNQELEANKDSDIDIRLLSSGGQTRVGIAMLTKFVSLSNKKTVYVDGEASSMAAVFACFADRLVIAEGSEMVFHKAAYPKWYEDELTDADRESLKNINALFKQKLTDKIGANGAKANEFIESIFEADIRRDVLVTPEMALELGLADEITKLDVSKQAMGHESFAKIVAKYNKPKTSRKPEINQEQKPNKNMTLQELITNHPELVATVEKTAVAKERDRVGAIAQFIEADKDKCLEMIETGEELGQKMMAELSIKMMQANKLSQTENEEVPPVNTPEPPTGDDVQKEAQKKEDEEYKAMLREKGLLKSKSE